MSRISPLFEVRRFADAIVYQRPAEVTHVADDARKRVLVVDDASLVRLYYRDALERAGFEVDEALNGLEALEKLLARAVRPADRRRQHAADGRPHASCDALRGKSLAAGVDPGAGDQHRDGAARTRRGARGGRELLPRQAGRARRRWWSTPPCCAGCRHERVHRAVPDRIARAGRAGDADLLALEKAPTDAERLDGAFRAFHTLKGGAGIVEFAAMQEALHRAEDVLAARARRRDRSRRSISATA